MKENEGEYISNVVDRLYQKNKKDLLVTTFVEIPIIDKIDEKQMSKVFIVPITKLQKFRKFGSSLCL